MKNKCKHKHPPIIGYEYLAIAVVANAVLNVENALKASPKNEVLGALGIKDARWLMRKDSEIFINATEHELWKVKMNAVAWIWILEQKYKKWVLKERDRLHPPYYYNRETYDKQFVRKYGDLVYNAETGKYDDTRKGIDVR